MFFSYPRSGIIFTIFGGIREVRVTQGNIGAPRYPLRGPETIKMPNSHV